MKSWTMPDDFYFHLGVEAYNAHADAVVEEEFTNPETPPVDADFIEVGDDVIVQPNE